MPGARRKGTFVTFDRGRQTNGKSARNLLYSGIVLVLMMILAACGTVGPAPLGPPTGAAGPDGANLVVMVSPATAQVDFNDAGVVTFDSGGGVGTEAGATGMHYFMARAGRHTATISAAGLTSASVPVDVPDSGIVGVNARIDHTSRPPVTMALSAGADRSVALNENVDLDGHVETGGADTPFTVTWSVDNGPGIVTFADRSVLRSAVSFEKPGSYQLRLTADIDGFTLTNTVQIKVGPFHGTIWYVDPKGSDKNPGSSKDKPFATLQRAGSVVRPGDVIRVRGGVYHEYNDKNGALGLPASTFTTDGTKNDPIVIESQPGEHAIFDGTNWPNGKPIDVAHLNATPGRPILLYLPVNHYIIRNMEFRHSAGGAISSNAATQTQGGSYNAFVNLDLHHNHGNGLSTSGLYSFTQGNLAEFIASHNNASIRNGGNSADGIKMSNTTNSTVRYVQLYKNSDDGVDFYGSTDMTIEHSSAWLNGYYFPDDDNDPYSTRGQEDAPTGNGNGFKMGGGNSNPNTNNEARFNLAWNNKVFGFTFNGDGGLKFNNNTAYANHQGGFAARCYDTTTLRNNLSLDNEDLITATGGQCPDGTMPDTKSNSWDLNINNAQVLSTDPTSPNFLQPKRHGGAIDKGTDIGYPYTGTAPDLGALQLGLTPQASPQGPPIFAHNF